MQLPFRQLLPYINKQGGTHSIHLNELAMQFWEWCHSHAIVPTATYLPGQDNFVADFLSRGKTLLESKGTQSVFLQLERDQSICLPSDIPHTESVTQTQG